jgi:hypothetical protein
MSISSPSPALPVREMLTRTRPTCGRGGGDLIDVVGARRSAVDPAGHAVLQANARALRHAGSMGVDVDQTRGDDLAAGIYGIGGIASDIDIDRGDLARDDRHVADSIKSDRWIDHAPAFDNEIIGRGGQVSNTGERRCGSRCAEELAPVHCGPPFPNIDDGCSF